MISLELTLEGVRPSTDLIPPKALDSINAVTIYPLSFN